MARVLVFDPSGNYKEGEGTTGWAVFDSGELTDFGAIKSEDFKSQELYWTAHSQLISDMWPNTVLMESYHLFAHKAMQQSWSEMETPQLIGYLRMHCWHSNIEVHFQDPQDKVRVADPILVRMGVFEKKGNKHYCMGRPTVIHMRDAIRHGIFYHRYGKGKTHAKQE